MKRLMLELTRWRRQAVTYCYDCPPPHHKTKRMRRPIACYRANQHAADSGHRVAVKLFG